MKTQNGTVNTFYYKANCLTFCVDCLLALCINYGNIGPQSFLGRPGINFFRVLDFRLGGFGKPLTDRFSHRTTRLWRCIVRLDVSETVLLTRKKQQIDCPSKRGNKVTWCSLYIVAIKSALGGH